MGLRETRRTWLRGSAMSARATYEPWCVVSGCSDRVARKEDRPRNPAPTMTILREELPPETVEAKRRVIMAGGGRTTGCDDLGELYGEVSMMKSRRGCYTLTCFVPGRGPFRLVRAGNEKPPSLGAPHTSSKCLLIFPMAAVARSAPRTASHQSMRLLDELRRASTTYAVNGWTGESSTRLDLSASSLG